jgi:hypothetical protein
MHQSFDKVKSIDPSPRSRFVVQDSAWIFAICLANIDVFFVVYNVSARHVFMTCHAMPCHANELVVLYYYYQY